MATSASQGQCSAKVSLRQALPSSTHRKYAFGKKRIPLKRRVALHHVLRVQSQAGFFRRGTAKVKEEEEQEIDVEIVSEPTSGTKKVFKLPGTVKLPGAAKSPAKPQSLAKSNKVVFVAGATGKVGSRTVRELLKLGFQVRAGTRNAEKAQALFEDSRLATGSDDTTPLGFFSPAKLFGFLKPKSGKGLEIVECDLEDAESIEPALGNAGTVVCCIGASEKEVLDVSGPYRIDFKATANLIDAASSAQVNHFVLVTSLGTQKIGFPAVALNLFWGVLVWKAKAEKALLQSGLPYTIVRPGGMERPTDTYKETHNLVLAEADKLFGGQVSNLQVAELLASIVENPEVSVNKIIEAVAETTAPLRQIRELLEEISAKDDTASSAEPQRIRKTGDAKADVAPQKVSKRQEEEKLAEEKRALALKEKEEKRIQAEKLAEEKLAKTRKEEEEKRIRAENEEKEKLRLQTLRKKYEEEIEVAREKEEAASSAAAAALAQKAELDKRVADIRAKAEAAALAASQAKAVEAAVLAAARKGNVLSDAEKEKIVESVRLTKLSKEDGRKESKPSSKKRPAFSFFGKAVPSTEIDTDVESPKDMKEDQAKLDAESKAKVKAEKEAAAKLAEQKKAEEKARKQEEAKKLAEQETAKAKQKAEQDKLEKEAKERAEKEAAEAKRKEEVEAKRKEEEAEARRKEAAEAKRREDEAEARRKEEEAEAKRNEDEAKARRKEEEAKAERKELEEAKKKEELEKAEKEAERLKAEAEEKARVKAEQEAEAKRKEEELAEAKKKEEQEKAEKEAERLKAEAEEKARAKAEQEAEAKRKEELAEAKKKEELEKAEKEAERLKAEAEEKARAKAEQEAEAKRKEEELAEAKKKEEQEKAEKEAKRLKVEAEEKAKALAEQEAAAAAAAVAAKMALQNPQEAEKAPSPARRKGFRWFWQPAEQEDVAEVPVQAKYPKRLPPSPTPLSPYTRYPGLKPPFPPIASPPTAKAEKADTPKTELVSSAINRVEQAIEELLEEKDKETIVKELSPEESQEDIEARARLVQESAAREREALEKAESAISFKWLWERIDSDPAGSKSNDLPRSSRPLSPYAQFPNLKPPAPPRASLPVPSSAAKEFKEVEPLPNSSTPLSPYPGFPDLKPPTSPTPPCDEVNGALPESAVETQEKNAEPAFSFGFKWPWQQ